MGDSDKSGDGVTDASSERTLQALRGLVVLLVPLGGIVISVMATKHALESQIRLLQQRVEYQEQEISELSTSVASHAGLGIGGVPHPHSTISALNDLEKQVSVGVLPKAERTLNDHARTIADLERRIEKLEGGN